MILDTNEGTGHDKSWLQRVAEQSWEPELLISGLAIYATIQMPDIVRDFYQYYKYNLQLDTGFIDELVPILVAGVVITAFQVLSFAFVFHFAVRAFWVGVMGLTSVFEGGIQYDKLQYSKLYREEMQKRLGNRDSFLLATDRLASLVFSVAFLFVLYLFGVGVLYLAFFLLMNGVKLVVSESVFDLYSTILIIVAGVLLIGVSVLSLVLNSKRFREQEKYARLHFKLTWHTGKLFYPLIYKPIQYLILTFMSNLSAKKFHLSGAVVFIVFFSLFMRSTFDLLDAKVFEPRDYFITRSSEAVYDPGFYDSEFEGELFQNPAINFPDFWPGEIVELFLPYPKMLDIKLGKFCEDFEPDEELPRFQRRKLINLHGIDCANRFFTLVINEADTIPTDLRFTYHARTGQAGYHGVFTLPDTMSSGKHTLSILRPVIDDADAERDSLGRLLSFEAEIPFWVE